MTPLDKIFAAVTDDDQTALMRAYHFLADQVLFVLLETEATAAAILPKVFDLPEGKVILAFDTEERLSTFGDGGADYAALPGRLIAQQLAGTDTMLGLNFGSGASSEVLLPTTVLDWLTKALQVAPVATSGQARSFHAPTPLPEVFHRTLQTLLDTLAGKIAAGLLVGVDYQGQGRGHLLAFIDAPAAAQPEIARAVSEAMTFSGLEAAQVDVTFLKAKDRVISQLLEHALVFEPRFITSDVEVPKSDELDLQPAQPKPAAPPRLR